MEAHSLFLQAAGASSRFVHALADGDELPGATHRQHVLIEFADKLTRSPQSFVPGDTEALRSVLADEGEVVEAVTVVAGFNFANRVADSLAVPLEVPRVLSTWRLLRYAGMTVMSFGIRLRMNFINRTIPAPEPGDVLAKLSEATDRAGMGRLPSYFEKLRPRPYILAGQAAICASLLKEPGFPLGIVRKIGYLVSTLNQDWECVDEFARLLYQDGAARDPIDRIARGESDPTTHSDALENDILGLARDITLQAHQVSDSQVNSLRAQGLRERQVLDLVLLTASYNAGNRLNRALSDVNWSARPLLGGPVLQAAGS